MDRLGQGFTWRTLDPTPGLQVLRCGSEEVYAAIIPPGTWNSRADTRPFHGSLSKRAQCSHLLRYTQKRDMKKVYANERTSWLRYTASFMAMLNTTKKSTPRQRGLRTKHLFDWMEYAQNLSKSSPIHRHNEMSRCSFCGLPETQQHINVACSHPPLVELRRSHRRYLDEFFQMYLHQHLPAGQRWIAPILDYVETHFWNDTELGRDIWNGSWKPSVFEEALLPISQKQRILPGEVKLAL